jgi:hypothetical protein
MAGDFDMRALFQAVDDLRRQRGLTWARFMKPSPEWRERWPHRKPMSASTVQRMWRDGNGSCQHAMKLLMAVGRPPEDFMPDRENLPWAPLPDAPYGALRWDALVSRGQKNTERMLEALLGAPCFEHVTVVLAEPP